MLSMDLAMITMLSGKTTIMEFASVGSLVRDTHSSLIANAHAKYSRGIGSFTEK